MIIKPNNPYKIFLLFSIYIAVDNVNRIIRNNSNAGFMVLICSAFQLLKIILMLGL